MDSATYYFVWHAVYVVIIVPTVLGNSLIIVSIFRYRRLRCNIHVLIGNLAVSDLIVGAILLPVDMFSDIFKVKATSKYVCLTIFAIYVLSLGSSCFNLLLISIERFIAIMYPLHVKTLLTKKTMLIAISGIWLLSFVNATIPLYGIYRPINDTFQCRIEYVWTKEYRTVTDWQLIISLLANFVFYTSVAWIAVRKSRRQTNMLGDQLNIHTTSRTDFNQLITMVIVLGTFLLCWLPYASMAFVVTFWDSDYHQYIKRCTLIPGLINSAVNWLIYGYRKKDFRKAFRAILRCRKTREARERQFTVVYHTSSNCSLAV